FLLRDDDGDTGVTFQSGLLTLKGDVKPSYAAFRLPVFLPVTSFEGRSRVRVWGLLRPAPNGTTQRAAVEFRSTRGKTWRTVRTLTAEKGRGYVDGRVRLPGTGRVRLRW